MLEQEQIEEERINCVKIELYPFQKRKGFVIAGKCNPYSGKIWIYPKTKRFCNTFTEKYGKDLLVFYAGNRARASLIHELLHLKYSSDEAKVRVLTKTYFSRYIRSAYGESLGSISICNLIFRQGTKEEYLLSNQPIY